MTLRSRWIFDKEEVVAENGIVVSKHPLAAAAGLEILRKGGNAIDAAVATGFTLCVVEPMMTCIAGCGLMVVHLAERGGENWVVEYPPRAPKAATPDMYKVTERDATGNSLGIYEVEGNENSDGYRAANVPATVAGLCLAQQRFGTLPLAQVMEPAIHYAQEGFEASWYHCLLTAMHMEALSRFPATAAVFLPNGFPPKRSPTPDRIVQRDLAETLKRIARYGPDGFYRGEIAEAIDADMRKNGGLITREDLAAYRAFLSRPLQTSYRGYEVLGATSPNGAITQFQTLHILENFALASLGHNSPDHLHLLIEASRRAFADRYAFLGDPEYVDVPLKGLLSKEHARDLAATIDPLRAWPVDQTHEPWTIYATRSPSDPWKYEGRPRPPQEPPPSPPLRMETSTTHFSVVDRYRNTVSCTQTAVAAWGAKVVIPGTGVLLADGMVWFNPRPGVANSIAPFKRPLMNMGPLIVLRDGRPFLSLGAPGGRRIINALVQVVSNVVDFGMGIQEAIRVPRIDCSSKETLVDDRIPEETVQALAERGHPVRTVTETPADYNFATPLGILIETSEGKLHGGVDVYRIAEAHGY